MRLRNSHLFLALGIILMAIAFVARSGLFTRKNPGEPANKYMRAALDASKIPQLSTEEAAVIAEKYNTAALMGWLVIRVTADQIKSGQALGWIEDALKLRRLHASQ